MGTRECSEFMTGCWAIWECRNKAIFEDGMWRADWVVKRTADLLVEMKESMEGDRVGEEGSMVDGLTEQRWSRPEVGLKKFNVDAETRSMGVKEAEAMAILTGLEEVVCCGERRVLVESDCLNVVKDMKNGKHENTSVIRVAPVPTPQCIDVDEMHAGNCLSLMVTPGGSEEWVRNIATEFTPTIGQIFATLDEGIQFYETYAIACGFQPRKYSTKRFRSSGDIRTKLIVCHREGFRDSKPTIVPITGEEEEPMVKAYYPKKTKFHAAHNHLLSPLKYREFQKKCRNLVFQHKQSIVDNCKVNIGPTSTFKSVKEYVDGYENLGACLTDFKNFGREIKCFIGLKDAQMFVDQLETLHETQEGFYYTYDIDQNKCLFRLFWADAAARHNYSLYGEAVTFDPTYLTNKYDMIFAPFTGVDHHKKSVTFGASLMSRENDQNFKWIFTKFLAAMGGKEPHCFFTDQCPAMETAVPAIFTTDAHRYYMWHIMKKLPEKLGTIVTKETDLITHLNYVVWDSDLEPSDFEEKWCALISELQLEDNAWWKYLFSKRQCWIPVYYRDIPLGCILRTTQRSESENSFFKRFENPHGTLVEFWMRFQSAMDQQRHTQKSLDKDSDQSLPQTKTLLSLKVHASTIYTHALFYEFQQQCVDSLNSCSSGDSSRECSTRFMDVEDSIFHKTYTVALNLETFDATCSCKMFERKGYICKHIIWILSGKGAKKIPDKYLLSRWTKNTKKCLYMMFIGNYWMILIRQMSLSFRFQLSGRSSTQL
ncbi:protein FAR1-RELATED SEQUENCE 9-like [Silene latifolia]|uniref:protein FAR1-RELATED SEQUENCE 9-like n=1 Tax=Silene latifolia TaxID=37657 RepID=UPI003D76BF4F